MAKQQVCQKYIFKIHSARLRNANWNLTLPLAEARLNEEIISLADSLVLRWLDELNGITDADARAKEIKKRIRQLRKEQNCVGNKKEISRLYMELDEVQFKPDYVSVIIDKEKDYRRMCKGFTINGVKYKRLLGTVGGVKHETIVFMAERNIDEIRRRIENDRNAEKKFVPAKLEAYKALPCSSSTPVSMPHGVLVVDDVFTQFKADGMYLDDEAEGEPEMTPTYGNEIEMDASDGYGLMLPSLAERWSRELGLHYVTSGVNTRFAFEKGMVYTFDFLDFAENVAHKYIVKDAWGDERDIRGVELILSTSMIKLWDSYESCEDYFRKSIANGYSFGVPKACPDKLENERTLNYQFIQSYNLSDEDIEELIRPTMTEMKDILRGDVASTLLFLGGIGMNERSVMERENDFVKALMIDPDVINDPYVQSRIYNTIKNKIDEAKIGKLKVHGNYSMISGDPYLMCQNIFGLPLTGLLKAGEIYNEYWFEDGAEEVVCFRAPMTCHNNIRKMRVSGSDEARYWFRYMHTVTIFNGFDTSTAALNGADYDGDTVMITDNRVLVERLEPTLTLMCVQRSGTKIIPTEEDMITANIASFGDDVGKVTNRATSMYDVRAKFPKGSKEYETLSYRIMCGQLYQQNCIDKAKGIECKPMPKEWYDFHSVNMIEDDEKRRFYRSIIADRKPYFMRYIYPDLMKDYNRYVSNTEKNALREFGLGVNELKSVPEEDRSERMSEFLRYYDLNMPVGTNNCVMNRICRRFEEEFDGYLSKNKGGEFDHSVYKYGVEYDEHRYRAMAKLHAQYNASVRGIMQNANFSNEDDYDRNARVHDAEEGFIRECVRLCPNEEMMCDIIVDVSYKKASTRRFAWSICGGDMVMNLLERSGGWLSYPEKCDDGDITFAGERFTMKKIHIGGIDDEYHFE